MATLLTNVALVSDESLPVFDEPYKNTRGSVCSSKSSNRYPIRQKPLPMNIFRSDEQLRFDEPPPNRYFVYVTCLRRVRVVSFGIFTFAC